MSFGKPVAVVFTFSALMILAGFMAAPQTVAGTKDGCSPAYGVDPCLTSTIPVAAVR
ncbi:MAG: hypothetical protein RIR97_1393 [Pseudomonadota bacterium]